MPCERCENRWTTHVHVSLAARQPLKKQLIQLYIHHSKLLLRPKVYVLNATSTVVAEVKYSVYTSILEESCEGVGCHMFVIGAILLCNDLFILSVLSLSCLSPL